ncbi:MAG: PAS domain S-box protein [Phormidesmis sp. RL_2_1]|nr:PAS domain S-box protein [Phormidesmis sp. RL_2_1]
MHVVSSFWADIWQHSSSDFAMMLSPKLVLALAVWGGASLIYICCQVAVKLALLYAQNNLDKLAEQPATHPADVPGLTPELDLFRQAVAHSSNGLIICDAQQPDLPIIYVSPSFEALTGYDAAEIWGKNCRFLQGEETEQIGLDDIRQAVAAGTKCKVLLRNYRKDGTAFWNELTLSPLLNNNGVVTHYVGSQVDISHYLETFKSLQDSESRYRHLYEETPAMLHSVDAQARIVNVSHYWLEKLGYEKAEVIGQPLCNFVAEDSKQDIQRILLASDTQADCRDKLCYFLKKNGDRMDVLLSTLAEYDGTTCSGSSLGVLVDVTERNKAKAKLRRNAALLRAINDLLPTGIFVMDCHSNQALFVNSEFYHIWQLEHLQAAVVKGELNGEQLLTECLSNIDLGAFIAASTAEDFSHGNKIIEDEVPLLDGRTLRRIYGPIQENHVTFAYLYVFEDITERKQAVQKLAHASAAAEAANRAKSEFLANMSHELRSPLNAILGFTHILKNDYPKADQQENLDIIYRSGEHLLALINDVLDISKIEAGQVTLLQNEFDLYRLLDELQQMFHSSMRDKGLQFEIVRSPHLPRIVCSDRLKLRQILINLLSNALKFTVTGTITLEARLSSASSHPPVIPVAASSAATDQPTLTFAVTDTGSGIPLADQQRLFEAFVQIQSGLTAHEGTGLGLAISSEYVRLLGGELTVSSVVGEGSTFSFEIVVTPVESDFCSPSPESQGRVVGLAAHQPSYKILVVDDVAFNRRLLTHLLTPVGFEVKQATNGKEALAQWQAWHPDLIWMDMRMPVMSGEEATRRIRALEATDPSNPSAGQTPIIALTASAFDDNRASAIASGCNDFVSKPLQASEIFNKMAQYLDVRYQYDAIASTTTFVSTRAGFPAGDQQPQTQQSLPPSQTHPTETLPNLLARTPPSWQYALTQATLDLDDKAILTLASQLAEEHQSLAQIIEKSVKTFAYKTLLASLQQASLQTASLQQASETSLEEASSLQNGLSGS